MAILTLLLFICVNFVQVHVVWSVGSCAGFIKPINSTFPYGYKLKSDYFNTWYNSFSYACQTLHPDAQLAYFRDKDAMDQGYILINNQFSNTWIAVRQFNSSGTIVDNWYWADGVPLNGNASYPRYFEWMFGEPNDGSSTRCGNLWIGGSAIADNDCWASLPAVCEVHGNTCFL
jgi:hypothetical protein